jgi:3',5'-cyclic AMP phosphodiesterase CpdA
MTRLFHVSDLHFGAEDREALDWFAATVAAEAPDAIVITGDLTMRARRREFEAAAAWLEQFAPPVTIEVGNHDLPYYNLLDRFLTPYRRYRALERRIERRLQVENVSIVPLKSTARFQFRLNWSKGLISRRALDRTLKQLDGVPGNHVVLVACHHPLLEVGTHANARTRGGRQALAALASAGVDAVLTGHVHDPFDVAHKVGGRTVRLIGAGTLSERVRESRPSFNEIRVENGEISTIAHLMP